MVVPKEADTLPFCTILISVVDAEMCVLLVSPIVAPPGTNLPTTVVLSFNSKPALDIFTCSAFCNPTNTFAPNSDILAFEEFNTFIPSLVICTEEATEAESTAV